MFRQKVGIWNIRTIYRQYARGHFMSKICKVKKWKDQAMNLAPSKYVWVVSSKSASQEEISHLPTA